VNYRAAIDVQKPQWCSVAMLTRVGQAHDSSVISVDQAMAALEYLASGYSWATFPAKARSSSWLPLDRTGTCATFPVRVASTRP
jgi:hypothetical protein